MALRYGVRKMCPTMSTHDPDSTQQSWTARTSSVAQTLALGEAVASRVQPGDVIALQGELGAGKTQFVRGLARGLGSSESAVSSPTFVLIQEYETAEDRPPLVHIDAYRLNSLDDLESIGWPITGDDDWRRQSVVAVEWADRIDALIGESYLHVELAHASHDEASLTDDAPRDVAVRPVGDWVERFAELQAQLQQVIDMVSPNTRRSDKTQCPICGKSTDESVAAFPFCGDRCKTIDLGKWADGSYMISRPIEQADLDEV